MPIDGEGGDARWDAFIGWAKRFWKWEQFDESERNYKLEAGKNLAAAKGAFLGQSPDWEDLLKKAFRSANLVNWQTYDRFLKSDRSLIQEALNRVWGTDASTSLEERVKGFQEFAPFGAPGNMASFLLMADDCTQYPAYRYTSLRKAYELTGYPSGPNNSRDAWERYEHELGFYDKFIEQASSRGVRVRDRLDAQALVWCVTQTMPDDWPQDVLEELDAYQEGRVGKAVSPLPPPVLKNPWSPTNVEALAQKLLWQPAQLREIIADLQEKRQVIFYGPPGTGKTYVAREIARQCELNSGGFEIVQFHPSYSYEDFVEGFRPRLFDGQPGFELTRGPLRRIAEKARSNPESTFILVIDELNRGNVAKVFGELYFLLEYRDEEVRLQYGGDGEGFSLPRNLWFICTMNTADRSIALMDAALRRRFYFAPFFPDEPPIKGLLRRWLDRKGEDTWVADLVDAANAKLDRDTGIGPSYFMGDMPLDESRVRRIWKRAVIPYIEEQCFGDADKLREFDFDTLKRRLGGSASNGGEPTGDTDTAQASDADVNAS